eukprot:12921222-Prorocentrum_lima.AAC.1
MSPALCVPEASAVRVAVAPIIIVESSRLCSKPPPSIQGLLNKNWVAQPFTILIEFGPGRISLQRTPA